MVAVSVHLPGAACCQPDEPARQFGNIQYVYHERINLMFAHSFPHRLKPHHLTLLLIVILVLSACGSSKKKEPPADATVNVQSARWNGKMAARAVGERSPERNWSTARTRSATNSTPNSLLYRHAGGYSADGEVAISTSRTAGRRRGDRDQAISPGKPRTVSRGLPITRSRFTKWIRRLPPGRCTGPSSV